MRLTPERLLKLPMFNPILKEKSVRCRRMSSAAPMQPRRKLSYCDPSVLKNIEKAKSVNLSVNGFSEDDEQFVTPLNDPSPNRFLINHSNLLPVSRTLTFGP